MPTDVRCLTVSDEPYLLVRLVGVLDAAAEPVRTALLDRLTDEPEAAVVDVSDLRVEDPAALSVFRAVNRQVAEWPGIRVIFCAPPSDAAGAWRDAAVPVAPTRQAAFARLGAAPPRRRLAADLEPMVGAARQARELVTEACARWDMPEAAGSACIAVTEMVNNVVAHARTAMTVSVALRGDELHIAVRDHSRQQPRFGGVVSPTAYGGRGLLLVDTVARRWGHVPLSDGKVVWAMLSPADDAVDAGSTASAARGAGHTA